MAVKIALSKNELGDALERIEELRTRAQNLEAPLKARAESMRTLVLESFQRSESPFGEDWAPLAESTVERRRQGSDKPLIDTGLLRSSITTKHDKGAVLFGISGAAAQYGPVHQFGTRKAGRGKNVTIPARPFFPLDPSGEPDFSRGRAKTWMTRTVDAIKRWLLTGRLR